MAVSEQHAKDKLTFNKQNMKAIAVEDPFEIVKENGTRENKSEFFVSFNENSSEEDSYQVESLEKAKELALFINAGIARGTAV